MNFAGTWAWVKAHPYTVLGIVGGLVVFWLVYKLAGGGGGVAAQQGPSDAEVQAGAAVQIQQLQAQAAHDTLMAQLSGQQNQIQGQITLAGISSDTAKYTVQQQATVQLAGIEAQKSLGIYGLQTQQAISIAQLATQAQIAYYANKTVQTGYKQQTQQQFNLEYFNWATNKTNAWAQVETVKHSGGGTDWLGATLPLLAAFA